MHGIDHTVYTRRTASDFKPRVGLAGLCLLIVACSDPPPASTPASASASAQAARPVHVATVVSGPALPTLHLSGLLVARDETLRSFKVGGVIRAVRVAAGDRVRAGQLLAELDSTELDAAHAQAEQALRKAQRDLQRGRRLYAEDVLSREQLDDLLTAEAVATAQLRSATFNRDQTRILADADGTVLRRLAEPQETVAPGAPVLQLASDTRGWVLETSAADRDVVSLAPGDPATVTLDALPGQPLAGQVVELGAAADPRSGSFPVKIAVHDIPEPLAGSLVSGLFGRAAVQRRAGTQHSLDYVPLDALVEGDARHMLLFLCDADCAHAVRREVEIAFIDDTRAALRDPLPAGARVITRGASYLHDGDAVRVVD